MELGYLVEKQASPLVKSDRTAILTELDDDASPFVVVAEDEPVARHVINVPREANPDPAGRVIVATAERNDATLVSADRKFPQMIATTVTR